MQAFVVQTRNDVRMVEALWRLLDFAGATDSRRKRDVVRPPIRVGMRNSALEDISYVYD